MSENEHISSTPSSGEIKLIIDNSLLELEKRMTNSISNTLSEQDRKYMTQIVEMTKDITTLKTVVDGHTEKIRGLKATVATASSASAVLAGLITFLVMQISGGK